MSTVTEERVLVGAGGSLQRLRLYWNHIVAQSLMLIPAIRQADSQTLREDRRGEGKRQGNNHWVIAIDFNTHENGEQSFIK